MKNRKNIKYKYVIKAKNHIHDYGFNLSLHINEIDNIVGSAKGRILKKYVKHVLRCGSYYNDWFYMPATKVCMNAKVKNRPLTLEYDDYED